jgi:uncharacterized membrane protein
MNNLTIKEFIITGISLILVDSVFLTSISGFFNKMINEIQGSPMTIDPIAMVLTYLVIVSGIYYFIIKPREPILKAALLGWLVYFTFELTNKAIIKKWTWESVAIDGIWGGILFGLSTYLIYKFINYEQK